MFTLTPSDRESWQKNGWIVVGEALSPDTRAGLSHWVEEISVPASGSAQRLHYFEQTQAGRALCRTERFLEDHEVLSRLVTEGALPTIAGELLGERVTLYKEKVNHKAAGGAGFAPHQDGIAYAFVSRVITCLVAVDDMTVENGCLEFASYGGDELLPDDGDGCINPGIALALHWHPVPVRAGSAIFFSSHVPHRSGPNRTDRPRRAIYLTYNAAAEGDHRATYYRERDKAIAGVPAGETVRISNIGHFQGRAAR